MKKAAVLLLTVMVLILSIACSLTAADTQNTPTPTPASGKSDFENEVYAFSLPTGWKWKISSGDYFDLEVEQQVSAQSQSKPTAIFTVAAVALAEGETLQTRFDLAYQNGPQIEQVTTDTLSLSDVDGIEIFYQRPWGEPWWEFHDIWLEKNGVVYVLSCRTYLNSFAAREQGFASILDSFAFKPVKSAARNTVAPAETVFPTPPASARIVFAATGWTVAGSGEEIFVMNTDGSGITALSNSRGDDRDPAWSPDGKSIAFTSERDGNTEIYIMNADGTAQTRLTDSIENEHAPCWSPDGTQIVFARTMADNTSDLFIVNIADGQITAVTNTPAVSESYPDWSPDGQQLLYSAFGSGKSGIYTSNPDGTGERLILDGPLHYPEWSPDGTHIAFDGEPAGCKFEIYIMNADGSGLFQVTEHPAGCGGYNKAPSWSPDGQQLVYFSTNRGQENGPNIYRINVDGSAETALTQGKTEYYNGGFSPDWSPIP
jgi:TolB protein